MAEITIADLTTKTLDGNGVFDVLMQTIQLRLEAEYKNGRIKGQEYANVYLGAVQATIDQSLRFILEKQVADKQADLLSKQIAIADAQLEQAVQDLLNSQKQGLQIDAQTSLVTKQELQVIAETLNTPKQGLILDVQKRKLEAEEDLLVQKIKTERAEIETSIDGVVVAGRIGTQSDLYKKQTESFDNKAKQDAAKLMSDIFTILYSTVPDVVNAADNGFSAGNVKATVESLLTSVDVVLPTP